MRRSTTSAAEPTESTLEDYFCALSDERRRIVVDVLDRRRSTSLDELVDEIVARSAGTGTAARAEMSLVHVHLPRLADAGAVTFDGTRVETRQPTFDRLVALASLTSDVLGAE